MQFLGQHVAFRTTDGVMHHGILQSVGNDGIYVRAVDGRRSLLASAANAEASGIDLLQNLPESTNEVSEAFFPFFFFPFFALWWLGPWGWWW